MQSSIVEKSFEMGCRAEEISSILEKIFSVLNNSAVAAEEIEFSLEIAAREMLANAIEHGCTLAADDSRDLEVLKIKLELKVSREKVVLKVKDPGPGFDWKNCDLETMPKFEEKGRGLKMINQVSDQIKFNSAGNKITAVFKL
ncbi:serine/threonine-protein kinase RsbW [Halanaerobium saccharolyticum]|uniref:Serine/threonine-protein kinase RsbW n=1 Tax=Halanaerobium saccharolyticum TaxID=43595 RepID=A0A4R6LKK2_9FIRM|nr:ATP-binding protein [Halanaerobium saccharolyticum]TDO85266.1 serine/threonine-protein kinase RsbW [Halanaerobium saccharolyticum]